MDGSERGHCGWCFTLKGIFIQKKNLFHCARAESVSFLADHFTSLGKDSLTGHRGSRCTKSTTGQHMFVYHPELNRVLRARDIGLSPPLWLGQVRCL